MQVMEKGKRIQIDVSFLVGARDAHNVQESTLGAESQILGPNSENKAKK